LTYSIKGYSVEIKLASSLVVSLSRRSLRWLHSNAEIRARNYSI